LVTSPDHPWAEQRPEEHDFYVRLAIREKWSKRELQREFKTAWFERAVFNPSKSPLETQMRPETLSIFRDAYAVQFFGLPTVHAEADLHHGLWTVKDAGSSFFILIEPCLPSSRLPYNPSVNSRMLNLGVHLYSTE
jgi:hypothetical protein